MKVLFLSPNAVKEHGPVTPLGVVCVAASAREAGHSVALVDLCFESDWREAISDAIDGFEPDVIGISVRNLDSTVGLAPLSYLPGLKEVVDCCRARSGVPIVLGGPGFSILPREMLEYCGLTLGIAGEGEKAFCLLLERLEVGRGVAEVPGLVMCYEKGWIRKPPERVSRLDALPFPAVDLYDSGYTAFATPPAQGNIETKRGCAFSCLYCTYPVIQGKRVRLRSPRRVAEEMKILNATLSLQVVDIVDNVFNYPMEHAMEVCEAFVHENVDVPWGCSIHPGFVSEKLLAKMVQAGCRRIEFGADAASPKMLRNLDKGFDRDMLRRSLLWCKATGMELGTYILLGGPGEDINTVRETLSFLEDLDPSTVYLMCGIRIYPDTPLARTFRGKSSVQRGEEWLEPRFYMSEGMTEEVFRLIQEYAQVHPNWIVPGLSPDQP